MSMAMYMSGFRWSLLADPAEVPCLNLFLPSWTLDTRPKFVLGMFGLMMLALTTEGVSYMRWKARKETVEAGRRRGTLRSGRSKRRASLISLGLHGLQALLGYLLMIAAMTYSIELLLSAVVGLVIGHGAFFENCFSKGEAEDEINIAETVDRDVDDDVAVAAVTLTTNPCCAFMADEAVEAMQEEGGALTTGNEDGSAAAIENGSIQEPLLSRPHSG